MKEMREEMESKFNQILAKIDMSETHGIFLKVHHWKNFQSVS